MVKLRFVQRFSEQHRAAFLSYEAQFAQLERDDPDFPKGRRYLSMSGKEPSNTLIWECDFPNITAATAALQFLKSNDKHEDLFNAAAPYLEFSYTELYESLDI